MKLKELLKEIKETQDKVKKIEADENFLWWKSTMEDYDKLLRETEAMGVSTDCVDIATEVYINDETDFKYVADYDESSSKLKELKEELLESNLEDLGDEINELSLQEIWDLAINILDYSKLEKLANIIKNEAGKEVVSKQQQIKEHESDIDVNEGEAEEAEKWAEMGKSLGFGTDDAMWTDYDEVIEKAKQNIDTLQGEIKELINKN